MDELSITMGLLIAIVGIGWVVFRVVRTLGAGGENSSRADTRAVGDLPGSEHIDDLTGEDHRPRAHQ
jgi:hypothetical protein